MCSIKRRTNCQKQLVWFLIVPEGTVTHFHALFRSVELFLQEYNSLTQKINHSRRMTIFVEFPTVHDSAVFCISVNWKGQPAADRSVATIFKPHVLSYELPLAMLKQLLLPSLRPFEHPVQGVQRCCIS
jgi:hypothetical protein